MRFEDVVIASAVRTPIGKLLGKLWSLSAVELGSAVVREAMMRCGVDPPNVDECIMGTVLQAGLGQNPARQAAIRAGLPDTVPAFTVNKVCGSGLKSVALGAQSIQTGDSHVIVAGGMESMSNAPYFLTKARTGYRLGNGELVDSMLRDGLWDVYNDYHMGVTAENIATKFDLPRQQQDAHATESHRRAASASASGLFHGQISPIEVPGPKRGESTKVETDQAVRPDTTEQALRKLTPVFTDGGTVTAGNASGLSDGAAALVLMSSTTAREMCVTPLAYVRAQASTGIDPAYMGLAPISGVHKLLAKAGWAVEDVDLFELNKAFSVQSIAVTRELGLDRDRVIVRGGAVALGHPIGASGARVLTTLLYALIARGLRKGVAALCIGGGNSIAVAIERA